MSVKMIRRHSQIWSYILAVLIQTAVTANEGDTLETPDQAQRSLNVFVNTTTTLDDTYARVIGGTQSPINAYPWFARATSNNNQNDWGGCGGSLVSPSFVITAAHCIDNAFKKSGGYDVGSRCYGSADKGNNNCNQSGNQYRKVDWVWIDPNWGKNGDAYDYALVRLKSPVTNIEPVLMNSKDAVPSDGQDVIGMGFGATQVSGNKVSLKLLHVTVDTVPQSDCKKKYQTGITPQMVCAVRKGKDTCSGDSGGPLITTKKPYKLVGLASFGGSKCADMNAPGVYARVSNRYDVLVDTICKNTPSSQPTASFCGGGGGNPVKPPVSSPVKPPVSSPVKPPTTTSDPDDCGNGGCPGNTGQLEVEMLTDPFGDLDNFWYVKKGKKKVLKVMDLANATMYEWCSCLPTGKYKFFIKDREGDGFLEDGYLRMWWNGKRKLNLKESTGEWSKKKKNLKVR